MATSRRERTQCTYPGCEFEATADEVYEHSTFVHILDQAPPPAEVRRWRETSAYAEQVARVLGDAGLPKAGPYRVSGPKGGYEPDGFGIHHSFGTVFVFFTSLKHAPGWKAKAIDSLRSAGFTIGPQRRADGSHHPGGFYVATGLEDDDTFRDL